ncbi:MAG: exodeoxyribonuclease VII small subunit [Halioglobus sp.]|nr:exodeoxyribonuclease VII small subunit [Halioglobus sp.]
MTTKSRVKKGARDFADFETSIQQLESLIETLEDEDTTLEQALQAFEDGVKISRGLQESLQKAEQRVTVLLEKNKGMAVTDFEDLEDSA